MSDTILIGICGGSGCGKTTITNKLKDKFKDEITVIYHDSYYKKHDELTYEERCKLNYDCPDAFDTSLMIEHIKMLKRGEPIYCPVYDYKVHNRSSFTETIVPTPIIIVEGILILENDELRKQFDIKIYVDTDADERILRRIIRDVNERGRSLESIINQYLNTVKPMHEIYVEPTKKYADIIIPQGGENKVALNMIIDKINSHINGGNYIG